MDVPFIDISRFYNRFKTEFHSLSEEVFSSGKLIDGPFTAKCEAKLTTLFHYPSAILTSSCTDSIYFCLKASGIGQGDEVISTSFSFIASVTPIIRVGATPVFVDVNRNTGLMDIEKIKESITPKTKAIIAVHLYGQLLDMCAINAIAKENNLIVIEDAAQSIGGFATYSEKKSDYICLSFDPTKVVHAFGTGGAVVCLNEQQALEIKNMRCHYKSENGYASVGQNSRVSEQQAAFILFQLERLDEILNERHSIAAKYIKLLKTLENIALPELTQNKNFHKFVIQISDRDKLQQYLSTKGIQTMTHYPLGLYEHPVTQKYFSSSAAFSNCNYLSQHVLSLPIFSGISNQEINYVANAIIDSRLK